MATKSVEALIDDIRFVSGLNHDMIEAVRALVKKTFKDATEEVKYGGILFSSQIQFGGIFAYKEHVSVEFGHGAKISDKHGFLEGAGKGRRHIKLYSVADIKAKKLAHYLPLARQAATVA